MFRATSVQDLFVCFCANASDVSHSQVGHIDECRTLQAFLLNFAPKVPNGFSTRLSTVQACNAPFRSERSHHNSGFVLATLDVRTSRSSRENYVYLVSPSSRPLAMTRRLWHQPSVP